MMGCWGASSVVFGPCSVLISSLPARMYWGWDTWLVVVKGWAPAESLRPDEVALCWALCAPQFREGCISLAPWLEGLGGSM